MKKRRPLDCRALLVAFLTKSYVARTKPERDRTWNTSHLQSMAQHFGEQLIAAAAGAGECPTHRRQQVAGACPYCRGLWTDP